LILEPQGWKLIPLLSNHPTCFGKKITCILFNLFDFKHYTKHHLSTFIFYYDFFQMTILKFKFNFFPIMYTNIFFSFSNYKSIWKEKYLNFIIQYNFKNHSIEKINSITCFING
jgi:hypothetical protein